MSKVPISRSSFVSQSADEAWDFLSRVYTRARPSTSSPQARISFDTAQTPDLGVDRGWLHTARGAFDVSPDQVNIISVLGGRISLDFGRRGAVSSLPGDSYVYLPDSAATLDWDGFGALAVRIPMSIVAHTAAELTGVDPEGLRFTSLSPISPAHRRMWLLTAEMLWQQLSSPDGLATNPLVHRELLNVAAATALSVFPNTALTQHHPAGPGAVGPAAVRRAVAYIEAHASLPITITDVADAAGTTPRAIRAAFRRHLDTTPSAYLRGVRMRAVHDELRATDPARGDDIGAIAARWGLADARRFAAAYIRAYGTPPAPPVP